LARKDDKQALEIATPLVKIIADLLEFEGSLNRDVIEE
jgi:hypothetical protein